MAATLNQLGETLLSQIYEIMTGGDDKVPPNPNAFLSWCMPGIPFTQEDFKFCEKGFAGGATAEEDKQLLNQAFAFSQLVDFIPDRSGIYGDDQQQTVWRTSQARMSHMYGEILKAAKVVSDELTPEEEQKLEKFRNLLRTTKTVKDLVTDEEKQVVVDGPMLQAYNQMFAAYEEARVLYNSKRVAAMAATGPEGKAALADWSLNADLYRMKVNHALSNWRTGGYKEDVDRINAYIQNVTQRSMDIWKAGLQSTYEGAQVTALGPGQEFFYTTLIPANFAARDAGWTGFTVNHEDVKESSRTKTNAWSVGASGGWGLFSAGGSASGTSSETSGSKAVSSFKLSFKLTQAIISRPWFYPEFFMNRGWTLQKGAGWMFDDMPSDGQIPPKGNFIAFPISAIFARDIVIESAEFVSEFKEFSKSLSANAHAGWGPFSLKGSYSRSESGRDFSSTTDGQSLRVDGMQIIGFVNHLVGKAPNPLESLKPEQFH